MKKHPGWVVLAVIAVGVLYFGVSRGNFHSVTPETSLSSINLPSIFRYGFDLDSFDVEELVLAEGMLAGELLKNAGVPYPVIDAVAALARDVYPFRRLRAGKNCALIRRAGHGAVDCFVYEPDPYRYIRFHVGDTIAVEVVEHEVERCIEVSEGTITTSLWAAMAGTGHSYELIDKMEDALAWTVDFHHVHRGDAFRLVYEQNHVNEEVAGVGRLLGAYYRTGERENYAIWFDAGHYSGFYDPEGRPMKRAFLKAPVKYSRISSRYNPNRFHPILRQHRAHLGTDYAAPYGTPIVAVADGVVTRAEYSGGNGNYVRIRHDNVYETQYLHMQRFASGIRPGVRVKQNQVIGYVGSTGLATGPHVCFRFWKNGRQVDHLRENLPPPEPMAPGDMPRFELIKAEILPQLRSADLALHSSRP